MVHSEPSFCRGGERKEVKIFSLETSLAVQGLGLGTSTAGGMGSIPCLGTEIPQAVWAKKKKGLKKGNYLVVRWLGFCTFTAVALVRSLVGELKSYKPCQKKISSLPTPE